jgi:hypothetical protein
MEQTDRPGAPQIPEPKRHLLAQAPATISAMDYDYPYCFRCPGTNEDKYNDSPLHFLPSFIRYFDIYQ